MRISALAPITGLLMTVLLPLSTQAAPYTIDQEQSSIGFAGTHADTPFNGTFKEWTASIDFDATQLEKSSISAEFTLKSAHTGNAMYDGTLPQGDWFNVKEHPVGVFKSDTVTHKGDNLYHVTGKLTLRGITQDIAFDFILSDPSANPVKVNATFPIDRLAFDIGKKSDDKAEWVSQEITLSIELSATKAE